MASTSMPEHPNPLHQRAAAAAQALLAPGRSVTQREIQTMLEKNEVALRGWNALHKQQPAKMQFTEHKEWVRRCVTFRQQIGARLEVLASLADKQIAHEDEKGGGQTSPNSPATVRRTETSPTSTLAAPSAVASQIHPQSTSAASQQIYAPPPISIDPVSTSVSMAMDTATSPTVFPDPPMLAVGFASTSSSMYFPTGQVNPMQASTEFTSTTSMPASGVATSTHGYSMSSGVQTFSPNTYMTSTSDPSSSSAVFMTQPNYMMDSNMMTSQQQQFMPMPMNLASSASGNMFGNNNYGISSTPTSTNINNSYGMPSAPASVNINNAGNGSNNSSSSSFPVDPFITPLDFAHDASFGSSGFPMTGMSGMPMQQPQQHQMMGSINDATFGAPMVPNNFGYVPGVGMPPSSSQSLMPQSMPTHQFQPTPQPFHQHPTAQTGAQLMNLSPDSSLYGDNNVNIFEGLTDDAFFPMQ